MFYQQPPAVVERTTLAELEAKYKQCRAFINSSSIGYSSSPETISQFINRLDQQIEEFIKFTPQAEWLKSQNFPQAAQRLASVLRYLHDARDEATQMYQQRLGQLQEEEAREQEKLEQQRLDQLREEERREQAKLDQLREEARREEERLEHLREAERREQAKLDQLREETRREEERH